jgi:hypothetical protein
MHALLYVVTYSDTDNTMIKDKMLETAVTPKAKEKPSTLLRHNGMTMMRGDRAQAPHIPDLSNRKRITIVSFTFQPLYPKE